MGSFEARTLSREFSDDSPFPVDSPVEGEIRHLWDGELSLRWSILLNAVDSYRQTQIATNGLTLVRHQQDKRWFNSNDRTWPFSFLNICDAIGIDPSCVRKHLLELARQHTSIAAESRSTGAIRCAAPRPPVTLGEHGTPDR
jgi:hypothetical protein